MSPRLLLALAACAALAGCLPAQRVVWSHDGARALLIASDGLRVLAPDGSLGPPLAQDVRVAAWLGDDLVYVRSETCPDWATASALLGADAAALERRGDAVIAGDGRAMADAPAHIVDLVALYVRERHPADYARLIAASIEKNADPSAEPQIDPATIDVVERRGPAGGDAVELWRGVDPVESLRPSPDGARIAVTCAARTGDAQRLLVLPAAGGGPVAVDDRSARWPDWTPDGSALVYARYADMPAVAGEEDGWHPRLGSITRWDVADGARRDLAGMLIHEDCRVRCLADGRILFSSTEAMLPATRNDIGGEVAVFALDPGRSPGVVRITHRGETAVASHLFEPSPDGRRLAIADVDGRVALLTIATGEVEVVAGEEPDDPPVANRVQSSLRLRSQPAWRGDELCYVVPPDRSGGRARIVLRRPDRSLTALSDAWPEAAARFLIAPPGTVR